MKNSHAKGPRDWAMKDLPWSWRCLIAVLVIALGCGYLAAGICTIGQTELIDGQPGMSSRDLILKFHGGFMPVAQDGQTHSRMLEQSATDMRDAFSSDANFEILKTWLETGGKEESFAAGSPVSPKSVIELDCLHCHASDGATDVAMTSPFGPNGTTASYAMVSKFTMPVDANAAMVWHGPTNWRRLAVTTHVHLFAVPMLTFLLGALFLWASWPKGEINPPQRLRTTIALAPTICFLGDISCWWLARLPVVGPAFALAVAGFGALFGMAFMTQWAVVMIGLCRARWIIRWWSMPTGKNRQRRVLAAESAVHRVRELMRIGIDGRVAEITRLEPLQAASQQMREVAQMFDREPVDGVKLSWLAEEEVAPDSDQRLEDP